MTKAEYNRAYYLKNRDKLIADTKVYRDANHDQRIASGRNSYYKNRDRILKEHREYHLLHKCERNECCKRYYHSHKEEARVKSKIWRFKNKERIRINNAKYVKSNRSKATEWSRRWRHKNPAKTQAYDSIRRAMELNAATDKKSVVDFFSWVRNQDYVSCTYCGAFISGKSVEIDHIVPITRGGAHHPDNFAVSCLPCNRSKSDYLLHEWPRCPEKIRNLN